jgi:hypothetical protein
VFPLISRADGVIIVDPPICDPACTEPILIDLKLDRLGLLVPVEVRVDQFAVGRHNPTDVLGNLAHFQRIGSDDAELHGIANGRTEVEAVHPSAGLRQRTFGKSVFKPCFDALAGLQILRNDDDLRKVGIRQHWIEAEPEPRCALAHVVRVGHDIGIASQQDFRLFGRGIGDAASVLFTAGYTDRIVTSLMRPTASLPLAVFFQLGSPYPEVQQRGYAAALILTIIVLAVSLGSRWISARLNKYTVK